MLQFFASQCMPTLTMLVYLSRYYTQLEWMCVYVCEYVWMSCCMYCFISPQLTSALASLVYVVGFDEQNKIYFKIICFFCLHRQQ